MPSYGSITARRGPRRPGLPRTWRCPIRRAARRRGYLGVAYNPFSWAATRTRTSSRSAILTLPNEISLDRTGEPPGAPIDRHPSPGERPDRLMDGLDPSPERRSRWSPAGRPQGVRHHARGRRDGPSTAGIRSAIRCSWPAGSSNRRDVRHRQRPGLDTHAKNFEALKTRKAPESTDPGPPWSRTSTAGPGQDTLVLVWGDSAGPLASNKDAGRDHCRAPNPCPLRRRLPDGRPFGSTDAKAESPGSPYLSRDVLATMYHPPRHRPRDRVSTTRPSAPSRSSTAENRFKDSWADWPSSDGKRERLSCTAKRPAAYRRDRRARHVRHLAVAQLPSARLNSIFPAGPARAPSSIA